MGIVYRNLKDMQMPSFAYPDRHDGRVSIVTVDEEGRKRRKIIGHLTDSTKGNERMVPNDYFKTVYQDLWKEAYPDEKVPAKEISIGMYVLTLAITRMNGLYSLLGDTYGTEYVNNILDYAMFSIMYRSGVTQMFESIMDREVLFCDRLHGDSWYSDFFSRKITEDQHHMMRIRWVQELVKKGLKKVWLAIDGSNNDCEARRSFLAKYGFPKSHNKNKTIVGYMYAVDADTGKPVTYHVYEGSVPDCQSFQWMAAFLGGFGIEIEGVILDRGFATEEVLKKIEKEQWKYVIMLPTDIYGHKKMLEEHAEEIRWKSKYVLEDETIFGISDTMRLFGNGDRTSDICLYFDGASGSIQSLRLIKQIQSAKRKAEKAIASGKRASIERGLRKYLTIEGEGAERKVVSHYSEWDKNMASRGFFSLAVSDGMDPSLANRIYRKRDTSEKQFCILKSQEGGSASRVHKTAGIYSKFAVLFIASIIRQEIEDTCKELELDTNPTIQSLDRIVLLYTAENQYEAVRNLTTDHKSVLGKYGIEQDDFYAYAIDFNKRSGSDARNPERRLPDSKAAGIVKNTHKVGRPSINNEKENEGIMPDGNAVANKTDDKPAKRAGRPKGSKDKKPRKPRSDKGTKRQHYKPREKTIV